MARHARNPFQALPKGLTVQPTALVTEELPYPNASNPAICTWVEFDNVDNTAVKVLHTNKVGLSNEELIALQRDRTTAEYKEFATVLTSTLNLADDEIAAGLPFLRKCNQEGADPDTCHLLVERDAFLEYTDKFGADHRCIAVASTGLSDPGYNPVPAADTAVCQNQWAAIAAQAHGTAQRAWHTLPWNTLTTDEQDWWAYLGQDVVEAYQKYQGQPNSPVGWETFSLHVYVEASQPWFRLGVDQKDAAAKLGFTAETWGRQWALLERIFHSTANLLTWDELSGAEKDAVVSLGWAENGSAWDDVYASQTAPDPIAGANGTIKSWGSLCWEQQRLLSSPEVRITQAHWDSTRQLTRVEHGCFWHHGLKAARQYLHVAGDDVAPTVDNFHDSQTPGPPRESRIGCRGTAAPAVSSSVPTTALLPTTPSTSSSSSEPATPYRLPSPRQTAPPMSTSTVSSTTSSTYHENLTASVVCPPGLFSNTNRQYRCTPCRPGYFKPSSMPLARVCAKKRSQTTSGCGADHNLVRRSELHGAESTTTDDSICTAKGFCPAGMEHHTCTSVTNNCYPGNADVGDHECHHCTNGKFSAGVSSTPCMGKTTTTCGGGYYWVPGLSAMHDDSMVRKRQI